MLPCPQGAGGSRRHTPAGTEGFKHKANRSVYVILMWIMIAREERPYGRWTW